MDKRDREIDEMRKVINDMVNDEAILWERVLDINDMGYMSEEMIDSMRRARIGLKEMRTKLRRRLGFCAYISSIRKIPSGNNERTFPLDDHIILMPRTIRDYIHFLFFFREE